MIGDVKKQNLKEIWGGGTLSQYRIKHLRGEMRQNLMYRQRDQRSHGLPNNTDPHVDTIAKRLSASHGG